MNGRELIIYIMENHLEDRPVYNNGKFIGFLRPEEAAIKMGTGPATTKTLLQLGQIDGIEIPKGTVMIADNSKLTRRDDKGYGY